MKNFRFLGYRFTGLALIMLLVMGLCGCGSKDTSQEEAYRTYGIKCINSGKYQDAVDAFNKALKLSPGKVTNLELDICLYKARAQMLAGLTEDALDTYQSLIDYDDKEASAYFGRGGLYLYTGDEASAVTDFDKAISIDKDDFELYIGIYQALDSYGYSEEAGNYLTKASSLDAKSGQDNLELGQVYLLMGQTAKAIDCFQLAIDDGLVQANFYMGQAYAADGNTDIADKYYQEFLNNGEVTAEEYFELGEASMEESNYEDALEFFDKAASGDDAVSDSKQMRKDVIICYEQLGQFSEAKELMETFVEDFPDDEEALKEYTFLETR